MLSHLGARASALLGMAQTSAKQSISFSIDGILSSNSRDENLQRGRERFNREEANSTLKVTKNVEETHKRGDNSPDTSKILEKQSGMLAFVCLSITNQREDLRFSCFKYMKHEQLILYVKSIWDKRCKTKRIACRKSVKMINLLSLILPFSFIFSFSYFWYPCLVFVSGVLLNCNQFGFVK